MLGDLTTYATPWTRYLFTCINPELLWRVCQKQSKAVEKGMKSIQNYLANWLIFIAHLHNRQQESPLGTHKPPQALKFSTTGILFGMRGILRAVMLLVSVALGNVAFGAARRITGAGFAKLVPFTLPVEFTDPLGRGTGMASPGVAKRLNQRREIKVLVPVVGVVVLPGAWGKVMLSCIAALAMMLAVVLVGGDLLSGDGNSLSLLSLDRREAAR